MAHMHRMEPRSLEERPSTARLILRKTRGLVLVSSDLHGNFED